MDSVRDFFLIIRPLVLFIYGLTYFVMGLAVFLQSRRHSRLRLARDLYWLAAFGILHGVYEWGLMFIPLQAEYLPGESIRLLKMTQVILLACSFVCLMMFGAVTLERRFPRLRQVVFALISLWVAAVWVSYHQAQTVEMWLQVAALWARYLLGLTGSVMAAYGLRYQAQISIAPLNTTHIYRMLQVAGGALVAYALLSGLLAQQMSFFPANVLNRNIVEKLIGVPIEVLRSLIGLILAVAIIRALEIFEIEIDHLIGQMEIERVQAAERERIGQDIHDGAIQGVYSASLILESTEGMVEHGSEIERRLNQARSVLNAVNKDLRSYMVSLRTESPPDPLITSLRKLTDNPRFQGLLDITLEADCDPTLRPVQVHHIIAIAQEALSNSLRHARARRVVMRASQRDGTIVITVEDDGRGIPADANPSGYGLRSMRDRAHLLGGKLEIESAPGSGTRVRLTIPEENL